MGVPVFVMGESGSGKSASLRNFSPDDIGIFNVAGKPLPFRKKLPMANVSDYSTIMRGMAKSPKKSFVIDDSQYLLCFEMFDHAKETGYQKFTDMALHFYTLVKFCIEKLPADKIVYFLQTRSFISSTTWRPPRRGRPRQRPLGKCWMKS